MDLPFDVVDLPPCSPPAEGDRAPDFERPLVSAASWRDSTLDDLVGSAPTVLVFHPMLGSFLATYVWSTIEDRAWADRFDATVVGLTASTPYDARRFLADRNVAGRLFSDPSNAVASKWDLEHDLDGMAGVSEPRVGVFVLDGDRTIVSSWVATQWPEFPEYDAIESALADVG